MSDNIINFKCKHKDEIIITFDSKNFIIKDIKDYLNCNDFVEYLPGLFIKVNYYEENIKSYNVLKKLKCYYKYFLYNEPYNKKYVHITFKIDNKRDYIKIFINKEVKYTQYSPIVDELHSKYQENSNKIHYSEELIKQEVRFEHIDTTKILYPFRAGGDRCGVEKVFSKLNILNNNNSHYKYTFFNLHEMFLSSSYINSLIDICKKFERCNYFYNNFINGVYDSIDTDNWGDNITLNEANGTYEISNANHRVCVAKRFNIPNVYSKILTEANETYKNTEDTGIGKVRFSNNKEILLDFYDTLERLQLSKENGQYILINGLRGKELLEYIEDTTKKSIYQLYEEFKDKLSKMHEEDRNKKYKEFKIDNILDKGTKKITKL